MEFQWQGVDSNTDKMDPIIIIGPHIFEHFSMTDKNRPTNKLGSPFGQCLQMTKQNAHL